MAAIDKLNLPGYESFIDKFYADWSDLKNPFCNPRARAVACTEVICFLIFQRRINDAKVLFQECLALDAWNANLGVDVALTNGLKTKEAITKICLNQLKEAETALQTL